MIIVHFSRIYYYLAENNTICFEGRKKTAAHLNNNQAHYNKTEMKIL